MRKILVITILLLCLFLSTYTLRANVASDVYYISPTGNDNNSGISESQAWATFNRAWNDIYPGDTLVLMDGTYYQALNPNKRNGEPSNPITIRAQNDGMAIIDGEYQRTPVKIGEAWPGPIEDHFVLEGIVAKNSVDTVIRIHGDHNTLRRVSAYNANTDINTSVISLASSAENNTIEDCVAAGSGRKMINIYQGTNNIIRRCFTYWQQWDGRDFCGVSWPNGGNIHVYGAQNTIVENSIAYGPVPKWSILIQANSDNAVAIGNKILGSFALNTGMNEDGTVKQYGDTRPQPTSCSGMTDFNWPSHRVGFMVYGQGQISDNLFQDIFSSNNAGFGLSFFSGAGYHPDNENNRIVRATILNNGLDNPHGPWPGQYGGIFTDSLADELARFDSVENSYIDKIFVDWPNYPAGEKNTYSMNGEGARLTHRYVNGVLTNDPLWPWPMEERIQNELGLSVTDTVLGILDPTLQADYALNVNPTTQGIHSGEMAVYTIQIQPTNGFTETVSINVDNPPGELSINIIPSSITPPGQVTVEVQDLHDPSFTDPLVYTLDITTSGGGINKATNIYLLLNGENVYLPAIVKK